MNNFLLMRKLFILILLPIKLFAQNWAPTGAQWHYSYYGFFPAYIDISYTADTLIEGQASKILTKTYHGLGWNQSITSETFGYEYTYEDNGVVYLRYENQWDTLYNFNAQVGDSWRMARQPLTNVVPPNSRIKILATGILIINNETRKYLVAEKCDSANISLGWFNDTLIENIGFLNDYLLPYDQFDGAVDGNEGGPFRCYTDNNFTTYKPSYTEVCDYIMGTPELTANVSFQVYPNPVSDWIQIPLNYVNEYMNYSIYSSEGKKVQRGQTAEQIDVFNLPAGSYTLLIENQTQVRYAKVLVMR
jgi:hypothetical protein